MGNSRTRSRGRARATATATAMAVLIAAGSMTAAGCQNRGTARTQTSREQTVDRTPAVQSTDTSATAVTTSAVPQGVPSSARRVATMAAAGSGGSGGTAARVQHVTDREGTLYVYDATDRRVVWSGPVRQSATVVIDPVADAITVNDQQVPSSGPNRPDLDRQHAYELYMQ